MKKVGLTVLAIFALLSALAQEKPDQYFQEAVDEISQMLEGHKPIDFKRATFLTENAYYDGKLNYEDFCCQIDSIAINVNQIIVSKGLQKFKTAGNYAIFTYMTEKIPQNKNQPMQYDFENFMGSDQYLSFMVSSLLRTKKGNCHSLPYLYKILADELNVEAYLAIAPLHCFIKHKDEQGKWWNLELTSGTFSRTSFIMESFNVSDEGIESGLYLKPLDGKELLVLCLNDLVVYYEKKTNKYYGNIVQKAYQKGLEYCEASLLQLWKRDEIKYRLDKDMEAKGLNNYDQISPYPELVALFDQVRETERIIKKIGHSRLSPKQYREKIKQIENMK